ncbi:hypothetical protein AB0D38_34715, partial [Streptomyces sp. NPDC048279]|uniref:hypothetical protein n=1 Tax=Streptomyces sp. NPDC048279 TaxID=3154714 RepID=UPI00342F0447
MPSAARAGSPATRRRRAAVRRTARTRAAPGALSVRGRAQDQGVTSPRETAGGLRVTPGSAVSRTWTSRSRSRPGGGESFTVWAPNAQGVRVTGDFTCWDG